MKKSLNLYNFLFHYNHYTGKWNCFLREDYQSYFNGTKSKSKLGIGTTVEEAYEDASK